MVQCFFIGWVKKQKRTNQYLVENESEPNESERMKDAA